MLITSIYNSCWVQQMCCKGKNKYNQPRSCPKLGRSCNAVPVNASGSQPDWSQRMSLGQRLYSHVTTYLISGPVAWPHC